MLARPGTLCESCGYELHSLETDGACPECARPIASSLPERRSGSPFQNSRGLRPWLHTARLSLRPSRLFPNLRIESPRSQKLFYINISIATALLLALGAYFLSRSSITIRVPTAPGTLSILRTRGPVWIFLSLAPAFGMLLDALATPWTYRRWYGWAISRNVYRAVRAHASFAWIIFALVIIALAAFEEVMFRTAAHAATPPSAALLNAVQGSVTIGFLLIVTYVGWLEHAGLLFCRYASEPQLPRTTTEPGTVSADTPGETPLAPKPPSPTLYDSPT